jgi:hypothetical protein
MGSGNDNKPHQSRENVGSNKKMARCDMAQALCSRVVPHRKNGLASWVCRFQRLQRSTMEEMVGCVNAQSECVREWGAWKEW